MCRVNVDLRSPAELDEARPLPDTQDIACYQTAVCEYEAHKRAPLEGLVVTQYAARGR